MRSEFYYLRCDLSDKFPFSITRVDLNQADSTLVYGLKKIDKWDNHITFYYSNYSTPPDFEIPMICPLHFATKSFINALNANQLRCFDFISIRIYPENEGPIVESYHIINYIYTIEALDLNLSEIEYDPEQPSEIMSVPYIVLDRSRIPSKVHAFRLKESPANIIVSKKVMENLNKQKVTGVRFVRVEMS